MHTRLEFMTALSDKLREAVNQRINRIGGAQKHEMSAPRANHMRDFDHEMTISFPIQYRQPKENPLAKLRAESFSNDQKISELRKKLQKEEEHIRVVQKMIHQLTSFSESCSSQLKEAQTEDVKSIILTRSANLYREMLRQHVALITDFDSDSPETKSLISRISSLRSQISATKLEMPKLSSSREIQRIKRKSKYLQKQYEELDEFIRVEIECERREDETRIANLESEITHVREDIASARESLENKRRESRVNELKSALTRLKTLKTQLEAQDKELIQLRTESAEINSALDLQDEHAARLQKELAALQSLTKC